MLISNQIRKCQQQSNIQTLNQLVYLATLRNNFPCSILDKKTRLLFRCHWQTRKIPKQPLHVANEIFIFVPLFVSLDTFSWPQPAIANHFAADFPQSISEVRIYVTRSSGVANEQEIETRAPSLNDVIK
jgi:hypothetical protein